MPDTINPLADPTTDTTPTDAPVVPNQYTPPPPTATPDMGGGGVPDVGQPTSPTVMPAGNVPLSQMLNQAAAVHHGRIARALNAVGTILGGDTTYHITTNSDGSVDAVPQQSTPAEKWGRVAKAALMGAAKGFEVGQGPGGPQRAAAAGIETGMQMPQAQQDQTLQLADKMNNQNQQKLMYNANIAYMNTRNLEASWALGNNKKLAAEHDEAGDLQFNNLQKQLHMIDVGPAADVEQAATIYNGNPQVQQALVGKGGQLIIHHPASGPPHAYIIPEDKLSELNPNEQTAHTWSVDPQTLQVVKEDRTIATNTETGLQTAARVAKEQSDKLNAIKIASDAQEKAAQAKKDAAPPKEEGTWQLMYDKQNNPVMFNNKTSQIKDAPMELVTAANKQKQDAAIEKHLQPIRDAISFANDYMGRGVFTGPGDETLQDKFFSLAKPDSGFRMTSAQTQQLRNSANIINSLKGKAQHAITGTWFSDAQRKQIVDTMNMIVNSNQGHSADQLSPTPTGGGGTEGIPTPVAPARPGGKIVTTYNGKPGSVDANGLFTPNDGSAPVQIPGQRAKLPPPKIGDVVAGRTFLGGDPASPTSWR